MVQFAIFARSLETGRGVEIDVTETIASTRFETVIGLEVHAQVLTKSKMYCSCSAEYASAEPNTHVCHVCMGLPGALPVINREAIELCVLTGLALDCTIAPFSKLDRKNYVYPDLPKGYQVSQYDLPLCQNGTLVFESNGEPVTAGITRVHIEEDTGRLLHRTASDGSDISLVDLNRSGVPLMEIVGEPDLRSPEHARDYLIALRQILRYIGASTGNMEEGAFRCDANVSLREAGSTEFGAKVEIKNMNSFRAVERALRYEVERQQGVLEAGGTIEQETRGWVDARGVTVGQRTKEAAHDYRYFPEPDLPPLALGADIVERIAARLPELPAARRARFVEAFGLGEPEAAILTGERETADYFESVCESAPAEGRSRLAANWILNDLFGLQRERGLPPDRMPVSADQLAGLLDMLEADQISARAAKELLAQLGPGETAIDKARSLNLLPLDDDDAIRTAALETIEAFPAAADDYRNGKKAAIGRLLGETIKRTGGRARPDAARAILEELLNSPS
ncbi:MAG: Asp-tRNA(Asn)/Glu-tRNA(Gln) amidotransferase subunit GatB [Thermomicrobiales bacterium]|nr:Asp-tRNA(Asn)/Glu-tRNA(Gln) amidotransferase subunit GatB [Thermomicrobiales bacterium]